MVVERLEPDAEILTGARLPVDLDALVGRKGGPQEPAVIRECGLVAGSEAVSRRVEPSMSVNTRVTVPWGSSVMCPPLV